MISPTKPGKVFLLTLVLTGACLAQNATEERKYYRLDFVVKDVEGGKVINTRSYTTTVATGTVSVIRAGNKVPVETKGGGPGSLTYVDVGVNIDSRVPKEIQDQFTLDVSAEISSVATEPSTPPLIRQTKWNANVIVPTRKPTTIFTSDDPNSKRQTQLELTAVPIK